MTANCFYHPDRSATELCAQCGVPICEDCADRVAGRAVCHKCVQAVRARVEAQMAAAPPGVAGGSGPVGGGQAFGGTAYVLPPERLDTGRLVLGIVAASLIGLVGAIAVEKVQFSMHFGLSLLYIFIGYGIGYGLHAVTRRGGTGMAFLAVGIMFACLLVSHLVLASDYLAVARAGGDSLPGVSPMMVLPIVLKDQNFMHWVLIAIGLYSCFQGMMRRQ